MVTRSDVVHLQGLMKSNEKQCAKERRRLKSAEKEWGEAFHLLRDARGEVRASRRTISACGPAGCYLHGTSYWCWSR